MINLEISFFKRIIFFSGLFLCLSYPLQAQQQIKGKVTDNNEPLPGVSVQIEGTSTGTITDIDGNYQVTVPNQESVLIFSYIGYVNEKRVVGTQTEINVALAPDLKSLEEVVVIGYGTAPKKDITGAVSNVNSRTIEERQPTTIEEALQGQASGVLVTTDGDPNSVGNIQIRGASTINASGNGPLYVIDGVISENANFVSPRDIQSIDILKDASSAAIYGARGANGVILITTKSGQAGKPTFTVHYTNLMGKLAHKLRTTSADELRYYRRMRGDGNSGVNTDSVNFYLNQDNDWQDLLFRTSRNQTLGISISNGKDPKADGTSYYLGAEYNDNKAVIVNSWLRSIKSRFNITYKHSKLEVSNNLSFSFQNGNVINLGNTTRQIWEKNPWTSAYRPDGSLASTIESKRNPLAQALLFTDEDERFVAQNNIQFAYEIYKDLKFTTSFNARLNTDRGWTLSPRTLSTSNPQSNSSSNSFGRRFYWLYQAFLNYNKTIGDHNITGLAGFSADRTSFEGYDISNFNLTSEELFSSNMGTINADVEETGTSAYASTLASFFGRLGYNYKGRYIVQGTYRRDGSSRFGPNTKWGNFFSGSAAWRFSDEPFMDWSKSFLSDGKLRISIGQAGNDAIEDYGAYNVFEVGTEIYQGVNAVFESLVMGNSRIKWETTTSTNYGVDLSLFNGRLNFSGDYYTKETNDLLYTSSLPGETGKNSVTINLGSILNKGFEFSIGGRPVSSQNFTWDIRANLTFQTTEITELANHVPFLSGDKWWIAEGGKLGDFYVWKNLGVYPWDESNAYVNDQTSPNFGQKLTVIIDPQTGTPNGQYTLNGEPYTGPIQQKTRNGIILQGGDTEWHDLNNDGAIDNNDRQVAGNALPESFYGVFNSLRYKRLTLAFLFNAQFGNDVYNRIANNQNAFSSTYSPPIYDAILTSWQNPGDVTKYPYFPRRDTRGNISSGTNSLYIEDGSFIRLVNARLSYVVDPKLLSKIGVKNLNVFIYGNNLATWTNYSWYDPEFALNGLRPGEDNGRYPRTRELGLGVNLTF